MLYFLLVLGLVPGTNLQLTFSEVLALATLVASILIWRSRLFTSNYHQAKELNKLKRRVASNIGIYDVSAVQLIGRTIVTPPERTFARPLYVRAGQSRQYAQSNRPERYSFHPRTVFAA